MRILSYLYGLISLLRNYCYDIALFPIKYVEGVHVICIGNIAVGGTGKTPAVQYFVKEYERKGKQVAVVSRGYRGKRKEDPLVVRDRHSILVTAKESGDEAYLHALHLSCPVVVGRDRYAAVRLAKERFAVDTVILDDGFQHRKLGRQENVVLIDATNPYGGGLLPFGRLREDFDRAAKRATEFIITKADLIELAERQKLKMDLENRFQKRVRLAKHGANSLCNLEGEIFACESLEGKRVLLFSALANPENFEKTVQQFGVKDILRMDFPDHYDFQEKDFKAIRRRAEQERVDMIVTTEKDAVKIPKEIAWKDLYILKIAFTFID